MNCTEYIFDSLRIRFVLAINENVTDLCRKVFIASDANQFRIGQVFFRNG